MGGVDGRVQSGACRRRLAITVDKCCDWVNNCLISIHAKIILFHIRRGSMLKKIILGWSTDGNGSGLKFFKIILLPAALRAAQRAGELRPQ